jgi:SulP family sulfate permease
MGLYGVHHLYPDRAVRRSAGMISGAAGSMAVVIVALVVQHGVQYLLATVLLGGVMILFGLLRLGKLVRLVPYPVMLGFVNGLAIVIAMAQLEHFKTVSTGSVARRCT